MIRQVVVSIALVVAVCAAANTSIHDATGWSIENAGERILLKAPADSIAGQEMLLSSCISSTTHHRYMAVGSRPTTIHARIDIAGENACLRRINSDIVYDAADSCAVAAIRRSNQDAYLLALPVVGGNAGGVVTLDVTELFVGTAVLSPFPRYFDRSMVEPVQSLSRVLDCKSFGDNFLVKSLQTFDIHSKKDGDIQASAVVTNSLLLLPRKKMRPRLADSRVGLFTERKKMIDLSQGDFIRPVAYVQRWRVEPSDPEAWKRGDTVAAAHPIVYYIDSDFPETWKAPLRRGILAWNAAFLPLRLKNVIQVRDYPKDDETFDPDNLKYNCIRYVATDRGAGQGPSWCDPSTGELLNATVFLWASLPQIMNRFCFVQTAQANPSIRQGRFSEEGLASAIEDIIMHEIGHTLGLAHNMGGTSSYPVDSLLDASFVKHNSLSASVMDYVYYNYIVPPGRDDIPLSGACLGPYDYACIEYSYRLTPAALSVVEDARMAESWVDAHAGDGRYRYGVQQWGMKYDPTSLTYDISDDGIRAGEMSVANLKYVLSHMGQWLQGGANASIRKQMHEEMADHYETLLKNVLAYVGGIKLSFVKDGTPGKTYQSISRERQREALEWVARQLRASGWLDNRSVTSRFQPAVGISAGVQGRMAREIVDAYDKVVLSSYLSDVPYTEADFCQDLYRLFFEQPVASGALSLADKVLQREIVKAVLSGSDDGIEGRKGADAACCSHWNDDASTAFALDTDGYLGEVPVDMISERNGNFDLLSKRIKDLAASQMKKKTADQAHWVMIGRLLNR